MAVRLASLRVSGNILYAFTFTFTCNKPLLSPIAHSTIMQSASCLNISSSNTIGCIASFYAASRRNPRKEKKTQATQAVVAESASSCLPVSLNRELIMRHSSWGNCIHSCHSSTTFGFIPDDADDAEEPEGPREAAENWIESRKSTSMTRWLSLLIVHTSTHVEKMPIKVIALA